MKKFRLIAILLIFGVLLFSCSSKKESNNISNQQDQPPEGLSVEPVELPSAMQQSPDIHAQKVVSYIGLLNSFHEMSSLLTYTGNPQGTSGPPWVYSWTHQGLSITMTIKVEDQQYHWILVFNGVMGEQQFNNTKVFEAWESLDGSSGKMYVYDVQDQNNPSMEWNWQKDKDGTLTINFISHLEGEISKIKLVEHSDLSGSIEIYKGDVLTFKAEWNADGTGQWWAYDSNGQQIESGTWA